VGPRAIQPGWAAPRRSPVNRSRAWRECPARAFRAAQPRHRAPGLPSVGEPHLGGGPQGRQRGWAARPTAGPKASPVPVGRTSPCPGDLSSRSARMPRTRPWGGVVGPGWAVGLAQCGWGALRCAPVTCPRAPRGCPAHAHGAVWSSLALAGP
jgi:hypothetical protein